jgi:molybdopterin converting factor small subunit
MIRIDLPSFLSQRLRISHYQCEADTLREAFSKLIESHPQLLPLFVPESFQPKDFASIYLNNKLIDFNSDLKLANSDTITIMTAVSGG